MKHLKGRMHIRSHDNHDAYTETAIVFVLAFASHERSVRGAETAWIRDYDWDEAQCYYSDTHNIRFRRWGRVYRDESWRRRID